MTSESNPDVQVTILTAADVLTGIGLSVVPRKGKGLYAKAELKRFLDECGRTFGILQYDPGPTLKALVQYTLSELGGLSSRATPVNWKPAHGSIGNQQATFYAQVRTLILQVDKDYGCTLDTRSSLFPWIVKHVQWNRTGTLITQTDEPLLSADGDENTTRQYAALQSLCCFECPRTALWRILHGPKESGLAKTLRAMNTLSLLQMESRNPDQ